MEISATEGRAESSRAASSVLRVPSSPAAYGGEPEVQEMSKDIPVNVSYNKYAEPKVFQKHGVTAEQCEIVTSRPFEACEAGDIVLLDLISENISRWIISSLRHDKHPGQGQSDKQPRTCRRLPAQTPTRGWIV